jgi:hypothetical protein
VIQTCSFGRLVIDGKNYTSDLIIYPDGHIEDHWRRQRGHRLSSDDIDKLIKSDPEIIIAGTGAIGLMKPEKELIKLLHQKTIEFIFEPNKKAIKIYNRLFPKKRVGACFHLTC